MIANCHAIATNNAALWDVAVQAAIADLPLSIAEIGSSTVTTQMQKNERVAGALRNAELTLVEALIPIMQAEVISGRLVLSEEDDYLSLSASLASLLISEMITIDLRD